MGGLSTKSNQKTKKIIRKKIVVIGLESVGKTTLVQKLKYGEPVDIKPTLGFNLESFKSNGLDLMVFDIAGGARSMWPHYLNDADIIIYVVDSTDPSSLNIVTDVFHSISTQVNESGCLFMCLLNKSDLKESFTNDLFIEKTKVYNIFNCDFLLQRTSNVSGEGIDKLLERIEGYFRSLDIFCTEMTEN